MILPRDGDQLILEGLGVAALPRVPWDGLAPRALTRGYEWAIFKRGRQKSASDFVTDERQLELWPASLTRPRWEYTGAPLLVDLP